MNKWIVIIILAAVLCVLWYTNPSLAEHQAALSASYATAAAGGGAAPADLEYRNFLVASATRDRQRGNMLTYGYLNKIKVVKSYYN